MSTALAAHTVAAAAARALRMRTYCLLVAQAQAARAGEAEHMRQRVAQGAPVYAGRAAKWGGGEVGDLIHSRWMRRQRRDGRNEDAEAEGDDRAGTGAGRVWAWEGVEGYVKDCHAIRRAQKKVQDQVDQQKPSHRQPLAGMHLHLQGTTAALSVPRPCGGAHASTAPVDHGWCEEADVCWDAAGAGYHVNLEYNIGTAPLTEVCVSVCVS